VEAIFGKGDTLTNTSAALAFLFGSMAYAADPAAASKRYLFLDPALLEETRNAQLKVNPAQRRETVIVPDKPWEKLMITFYVTVREEGGKLRRWYTCRESETVANLAYAESTDGIHWTKPNLGIVEYQGSRNNNLVGISVLEGVVFADPRMPPAERYQYVTNSGTTGGIVRFHSPDGLRWKRDAEPLLKFNCDTQNVTFFDERLQQYVLYLRGWDQDPKRRKVVRLAAKSITEPLPIASSGSGYLFGKDRLPFITGEIPTVLQCDSQDPPQTDIYNMSAQPYAPDPSWYVAFPSFLRGKVRSRGLEEVAFAGSRDGIAWHRYDRAPYAPPGANGVDPENMTFMGTGLVFRHGEIWQYGTAFRTEHGGFEDRRKKTDGAIVRYTQRMDGFVSLTTGQEEGAGRTVPIPVTGDRLVLNVDTGGLGEMRVGLTDADGRPLPGYTVENSKPMSANSVSATAAWTGHSDVAKLRGRQVRVEFRSRRSRLYAFWFE
jgi:hypothetical protein